MKHSLRSNKTCLNCGSEVPERYCSHCGQENLEPRETVKHLITHFFSDITHYDSKFFISLKYLFTKPGFLTKEYRVGKRAQYLNPVRMYIFISFVFFLAFFSISSKGVHNRTLSFMESGDTLHIGGYGFLPYDAAGKYYKSIERYDSLQQLLPKDKRDAGINEKAVRRYFEIRKKYGEQTDEVLKGKIFHNVPKVMFLFLPIFALFLTWLHRKKDFGYVDHAIFAIHFHATLFIVYLIFALVNLLMPINYWIINIGLFLYLAIALRNAYDQPYFRSFLKAFVVLTAYILIVSIGAVALELTTFFFIL